MAAMRIERRWPAIAPGDLVDRYRAVLAQLWLLGLPSESRSPHAHQADLADARHLLAEQARLCDALGPEFASAVSREHGRTWAMLMRACPGRGSKIPGGRRGKTRAAASRWPN